MNHRIFRKGVLLALLFYPLILFLIFRRNKQIHKNRGPLRILIIPQANRIGDLVCTTPVFRAIKKQYPDCHLGVLLSEKSSGIIKNNPRVDEIIIFESADFMQRVRAGRYEWSFVLTNTPTGSIASFLGFIPNRVKTVIDGRSWGERITDCLNTMREKYEHHTYLPRHYLRLLKHVGISEAEEIKEVFPTAAGDKKADEFLSHHEIRKESFVVGISVTAGNKIKEWGEDNFAKLADEFADRYRARIVFLGSFGDAARLNETRRLMRRKEAAVIAANFAIEELPSLMRRFNLFVSVDTGPIYIANALGVPVVDITGPCDPREQPPLDNKSILVTPFPMIQPSSFVMKRAGHAAEHRKALEAISVDRVLDATQKLLSRLSL